MEVEKIYLIEWKREPFKWKTQQVLIKRQNRFDMINFSNVTFIKQ